MYELGKIRTFLSLNTDVSVQPFLAEIQNEVKEQLSMHQIKWEDPARFHLTLRFLGDIDEKNISMLTSVLERLKFDFEKITFTAKGIGFFPNPKYPNVVFIDLSEHGSNTDKLVGFIDKIILNFGVKPEKKFVPHITIGRFNRDKRIKIDSPPKTDFSPFNIEFGSFFLMQSILQSEGSLHIAINEFIFDL